MKEEPHLPALALGLVVVLEVVLASGLVTALGLE
jgi:hypothetical protein